MRRSLCRIRKALRAILCRPASSSSALSKPDGIEGAIMAELERLSTRTCIIGSGPAAHTAAIYAARAELRPILFEGWLANGIAAGGQLTTTTEVENFPGFPQGISGIELTHRFREQSLRFGTRIWPETVVRVDFSARPFRVYTDAKQVEADTVIVATGAVAKRLYFPGAGDDEFWNKGISACAVCDGAAPIFRNRPLAVIGGGDSAMEEAIFLTKYGSKVFIIHRRDAFRASKIMQTRALTNPKIEVIWNAVVIEAYGNEKGLLSGLKVRNTVTGEVKDLEVSGLFFAIGHEPATRFLDGQLELDSDGYVVTKPGTAQASVPGVFAAGDVQDKKWRQAITAAGTGCIAALEVEHFLQEFVGQEGYIFSFGSTLIIWQSKKMNTFALSTTEIKYRALVEAGKKTLWIKSFMEEIDFSLQQPIMMHVDNQGAISIATNPVGHSRTKYVELHLHFIRNHVNNGTIQLLYCPSKQ